METGRESTTVKRPIWTFFRILVGAFLLYIVFRIVNIDETWGALAASDAWSLLAATALLPVQLWVRTAKWKTMLKSLSIHVTALESLTSILFGITLGILTPAELGELAGRSIGLHQPRISPVVGLVLLDRVQTFLIVLLGGAIGLAAILGQSVVVTAIVAVAAFAGFVSLFINLGYIKRLYNRLPLAFVKREWLGDTLESFRVLSPKAQMTALIYSFSFYLVLALQMYFLLNASSSVSMAVSFQGFSAVMALKSLVPISIADLGTRELSSVYFFSLLGISQTTALNASLLLFFINMVLPGLAGAFFLPRWKSQLAVSPHTPPIEKRNP